MVDTISANLDLNLNPSQTSILLTIRNLPQSSLLCGIRL